MPSYKYYCPKCDVFIYKTVPMKERNAQSCDGCKAKLNKVVTGFNLAGFDNLGRSK